MKAIFTLLLCTFLSPSLFAIEWEEIKVDIPGNIQAMYKDGDQIYLGNVGMVKSTDGGSTFTEINNMIKDGEELNLADENYKVEDIYKTSDNIIFANVDSINLIYSTNDGASWYESNLEHTPYVDYTFYEVNGDKYIQKSKIADDYNVLFKSTDNGKTWVRDSFTLELIYSAGQFLKSPIDETLLCLHTKKYDDKYIVKYDPAENSYTNYPIDKRAEKFEILGDSWLLYMQSDAILLESDNEGTSWDTLANLYDVVGSFDGFDNLWGLDISDIKTGVDGQFIAVFFYYYFEMDEYHSALMYSEDKGENWQLVIAEDRKLEYFEKQVIDNNIYLMPSALSVLHKPSGTFEKLMYPFNTITKYFESSSRKLVVTDANHEPLWIGKEYMEWAFPKNLEKAWISDYGNYYKFENEQLYYVKGGYETNLGVDVFMMNGEVSKTGLFRAKIFTHGYSNREVLFKGIKTIYEVDVDYESTVYADSQTLYGFKRTVDEKYQLVRFNYLSETEEKLGKYVQANDSGNVFVDVQDQNILISHKDGIEFSKDAGESWRQVVADNNNPELSPKVYNNDIYIQNGKALLRSTDGETWENILDGTSKALIYSFEFDMDNRILVYTSNGTFRSKEPVSVEENTQYLANIDINIYPNPTSDIVNIESAESISNIELYNLSGELLSKQNGLTIDATDLANGTYFIKMQVGEKSIYKQFVVER